MSNVNAVAAAIEEFKLWLLKEGKATKEGETVIFRLPAEWSVEGKRSTDRAAPETVAL